MTDSTNQIHFRRTACRRAITVPLRAAIHAYINPMMVVLPLRVQDAGAGRQRRSSAPPAAAAAAAIFGAGLRPELGRPTQVRVHGRAASEMQVGAPAAGFVVAASAAASQQMTPSLLAGRRLRPA